MRMQVWSLALLSGLRIQHCHELWCSQTRLGYAISVALAYASGYSSNSTPSLGTSICCRCSPKKSKKEKSPLKYLKYVTKKIIFIFLFILFYFCLFAFSWAAPAAYGGSQARSPIGAVAAGLCQSYSNVGSEPCLWPTPQLTARPDP